LANEINPDMSLETFRDYFENGLNPSCFEMYYLLSSNNKNIRDLSQLVLKISDIKERELFSQINFYWMNLWKLT